jgi:hypothetical protein
LESKQLARVSALLDEAVEEIEGRDEFKRVEEKATAIAKIREAQGILLGERPVHPEEN